MVRRRIVVTGRVQGVFFRDSCQQEAERRGVSGWVTNADDGSVVAELEGEPDAVAAVVAWARTGSDRAEVDDVAVTDVPETGEAGFEVR